MVSLETSAIVPLSSSPLVLSTRTSGCTVKRSLSSWARAGEALLGTRRPAARTRPQTCGSRAGVIGLPPLLGRRVLRGGRRGRGRRPGPAAFRRLRLDRLVLGQGRERVVRAPLPPGGRRRLLAVAVPAGQQLHE